MRLGGQKGSSWACCFGVPVDMLWNRWLCSPGAWEGVQPEVEIVYVFRAWDRVGSKRLTVDAYHLILTVPVNWYYYAFTRDEDTEVSSFMKSTQPLSARARGLPSAAAPHFCGTPAPHSEGR